MATLDGLVPELKVPRSDPDCESSATLPLPKFVTHTVNDGEAIVVLELVDDVVLEVVDDVVDDVVVAVVVLDVGAVVEVELVTPPQLAVSVPLPSA